MVVEQPPDLAYRRLYYHLHKLVDRAIGRILDALESSGMADDTIVVFTSDHGDLLGAHGGMQQKWANAFDEALRVPTMVKGAGVAAVDGGVDLPTSHVDLVPTLMGLAGIDLESAAATLAETHRVVRPLSGRDLSGLLAGAADADSLRSPVYFMTDDDVTSGARQQNLLTGEPFDPIAAPARIESVVTELPTGADGAAELWKLNHYHDGLAGWHADHGVGASGRVDGAGESVWELHNLTRDPEERHNLAPEGPDALPALQRILESQREEKRLVPNAR
jgi:arylsulfatase A-like enzyme